MPALASFFARPAACRLAWLASLFLAAAASAASFSVTNRNDSGPGSLRQAVIQANNFVDVGSDFILFDASLNGQTIVLASPIVISGPLNMSASNLPQGITVRGNGSTQLFQVTTFASAVSFFRIRFLEGNAGASGNGGALQITDSSVSLTDCTLQDNTAGNAGGAIYRTGTGTGTLTLDRCTFYRNVAGDSGALFTSAAGANSISNCTFTANRSTGSGGTGAISLLAATSTLTHVTIFANVGGNFGGGIYSTGPVTLNRCLVAGNTSTGNNSPDLFRASSTVGAASGAANLVGNNGLGRTGGVATEFPAGALVGTPASPLDPRLRPLGPGGGQTDTLAPLTGSPALDAGGTSPLSVDQRNFARGSASDLGAVERGPVRTVTNANDSGTGSLRATLAAVNVSDTRIQFAAALSGATITLTSGELQPPVASNVEIDGSTLIAPLTLNGGNQFRVINANGTASLSLNRLILTGGNPNDGFGGGAVYNQDNQFLAVDCAFLGNLTSAGGAIYAGLASRLALHRCTLANNSADSGGALWVQDTSEAALLNCTLSRNQSTGSFSTGGIAVSNSTKLDLVHTTITGNTGNGNGGGLFLQSPATVRIERSIIAGNLYSGGTPDIYRFGGTLTAVAPNLIGNNGGSVFGNVSAQFPAGSLVGIPTAPLDPRLAPLLRTGGSTATHLPLTGSPAIDAAGVSTLGLDQRGFARAVGAASDLGAVERGPIVTVTNANDTGVGSLRAALAAVTAPDTRIQFAAPLSGATITLTSASLQPPGGSNVEIDASTLSAPLTLSGGGQFRIINNAFGAASLSLNRLILAGGNDGDGAGGGAILNQSSSFLAVDCAFLSNRSPTAGGAINATGASRLALQRCTLAYNSAGIVGALFLQGTSEAGLQNCTVSGNQCTAVGGPGGIAAIDSAKLDLVHTTITGNTGNGGGGGVYLESLAAVRIERSIIAGNLESSGPPDIYRFGGTLTAVAPNLVGNNGGGFFANVSAQFPAGPLVGTPTTPLDAKLAPLALGGGFTPTHALLSGSPALDAAGTSPTFTDQRGFPRGIGAGSDLGAYERGPTSTVTTAAETGAGSLRQALLDGATTILFDSSLNSQTIPLASALVVSAGSVLLDASNLPQGLNLRGSGGARLLEVSGTTTTFLANRLRFFDGNAGAGNGGAILATDAAVALLDCTFQDNFSNSNGGAVFTSGAASLTARGCSFFRNVAGDSGALYLTGTGTNFLTNCTLTGNRGTSSTATGAATFLANAVVLTHVTVFENDGGSFGGGVFASGPLSLDRCVLAGNASTGGSSADVYKGGSTVTAPGGAPNFLGSNGLGGAGSVAAEFPAGTRVGTPPSPLDPRLRPFGPGGGPTATLAPVNGSLTLDAAGFSPVGTDQRGFPRGVNGASDLGAVERGPIVTVTNANDSGTGSLRAALAAVTATDTRIQFAAALSGATITLTSAELQPPSGSNVEIDGSTLSAPLTISGGDQFRVINANGVSSLSLNRLTLTGGNVTDGFGGGAVYVEGNSFLAVDCAFLSNRNPFTGGAVFAGSASRLALQRCTLANNFADDGGALLLQQSSEAALQNCTVSGNPSTGGFGTGGIVALSAARLDLVHTTITGNTGNGLGGGLSLDTATVRIERSIIAGNQDPSGSPDLYRFSGTLTAVGPNLVGNNGGSSGGNVSAQFQAGSLVGTPVAPLDPKLAPLLRTGGFTATRGPLTGSPALDAAGASPLRLDQRGFPRGVNGASDLGAVERGPSLLITSAADSGTGTVRAALALATAPDTRLVFDPSLANATISVNSPLVLGASQNIALDASAVAGVRLQGNLTARLFQVPAGASLTLVRLGLTGGATNSLGGAILSAGTLALSACDLFNNVASDGGALYATAGTAELSGCRVVGNATTNSASQLGKSSTAAVTATDCWFGTNSPGAALFSSGVVFSPYLTLGLSASPASVAYGNASTLSARFARSSDSSPAALASLLPLLGRAISFSGAVNGTLSNAQATVQPNGTATATFTATYAGQGSASATFDGATASATLTITSPAPLAGNFPVTTTQGRFVDVPFPTILSNCADPNGLTPLVVLSGGPSTPQGGSVTTVGSALRYSPPNPQFTGSDTFAYTIRNAAGGTASGFIAVTVAAPRFPPGPVSVVRSGTTLTATFNGVPGLSYTIETTTSLVAPAVWGPLSPAVTVTADANGNFSFSDSGAGPKRLYRARALP